MRFYHLSSLVALLLTAILAKAQLEAMDSVAQPFERSLDMSPAAEPAMLSERDLLEARQVTNSSATTSSSAPVSTASGSAPAGGNATITEADCSMTNRLSVNQQASWGQGIVNTCCGFATGTQCWYRKQDTVTAEQECDIPDCADLESEDATRMIGFIPLNSTNGSGKYGNIFLSLGQLSGGVMSMPALWLTLCVAAVSLGANIIL